MAPAAKVAEKRQAIDLHASFRRDNSIREYLAELGYGIRAFPEVLVLGICLGAMATVAAAFVIGLVL